MAYQVMDLIRAANYGDLAACDNQTEVIKHLIAKGVDLRPQDRLGNTLLDDAIKFKHKEIKDLLGQAIRSVKPWKPGISDDVDTGGPGVCSLPGRFCSHDAAYHNKKSFSRNCV